MQTVVYIDGSPRYLTGISRNPAGRILRGFVVNGEWDMGLTDTEVLILSGDEVIDRHTYSTYEEVEVSVRRDRDYEEVITAAQDKREGKPVVDYIPYQEDTALVWPRAESGGQRLTPEGTLVPVTDEEGWAARTAQLGIDPSGRVPDDLVRWDAYHGIRMCPCGLELVPKWEGGSRCRNRHWLGCY